MLHSRTQSLSLSLWPWPGHLGWWVLCPAPGNLREAQDTFYFPSFSKKNCSSHLLHVLKKHKQHKEILAIILGDWTQSYTQGLFLRELFNPAAGKCPVQHLACPQPGGIKTYLGIKESRQGGFKQWHNLAGSMLFKKLLQWWIHPLNLCIDPAQSKPTGQVNPHPSAGVTLCIQMSHGII